MIFRTLVRFSYGLVYVSYAMRIFVCHTSLTGNTVLFISYAMHLFVCPVALWPFDPLDALESEDPVPCHRSQPRRALIFVRCPFFGLLGVSVSYAILIFVCYTSLIGCAVLFLAYAIRFLGCHTYMIWYAILVCVLFIRDFSYAGPFFVCLGVYVSYAIRIFVCHTFLAVLFLSYAIRFFVCRTSLCVCTGNFSYAAPFVVWLRVYISYDIRIFVCHTSLTGNTVEFFSYAIRLFVCRTSPCVMYR